MSEADAIVFMVDVKDGIMPADAEIADLIRRLKKPTLLVANKGDNDKLEAQAVEFTNWAGRTVRNQRLSRAQHRELIEQIIRCCRKMYLHLINPNHESSHRR